MKFKQLSDKVIIKLMGEAFWLAAGKRVARKAGQEIRRQVEEWGKGKCNIVAAGHMTNWTREYCLFCMKGFWQELKKQVEEEG